MAAGIFSAEMFMPMRDFYQTATSAAMAQQYQQEMMRQLSSSLASQLAASTKWQVYDDPQRQGRIVRGTIDSPNYPTQYAPRNYRVPGCGLPEPPKSKPLNFYEELKAEIKEWLSVDLCEI